MDAAHGSNYTKNQKAKGGGMFIMGLQVKGENGAMTVMRNIKRDLRLG